MIKIEGVGVGGCGVGEEIKDVCIIKKKKKI